MRLAPCLAALTLALSATFAGAATAVPRSAHAPLSAQAPQSETVVSENQLRDDWDPSEPGLTPAAVGGGNFGQLFATHVNGQVYAQPLVVDNPGTATNAPSTSVIVVTENNYVYSLNGTTGAVQWSRNLGTPWSWTVMHCSDLVPDIGITSTPVYDPATNTVYVFAVTADGDASTKTPTEALYALDESTGTTAWTKTISGSSTNGPAQKFDPELQRQRPGLLMMNGSVYIAFGSLCIIGPYNGFVAGVNTSTHSETLWADEAGAVTKGAGIWQSGGGLVTFADLPGSFFLATGNGTAPPAGPGQGTVPGTLGDSVVRLDIQPNGTLKAGDFFSPANAPLLGTLDRDLGSGGAIGLPFGTKTYPDLIAQAGKDGRVFLLNAKNLGGRNASADAALSETGPYGGQWGHPAAFAGANGDDYVYYSGTGYQGKDYMRVLRFDGSNAARPVLTEVGNSATPFGYTSGSPVVTSGGTDPGSAIVWDVYATDRTGADGTLEAFDAVPVNGVLKEIWSAPIGIAAKFSVVATDDGHVYVGTRSDGSSATAGMVYGLGVTSNTPFTGTGQVTLPDAGVGGASSATSVTLTATQAMQLCSAPAITSTTSPSPFSAGTVTLNGQAIGSYPVGLEAGDQLVVPVTFTPAAAGGSVGSVQLATNVTGFTTVTVPLAGNGTTPGLTVAPQSLAFGAPGNGDENDPNTGPIPIGESEPFEADVTNTATVDETVTSITGPSSPFRITGGLTAGQVLTPGQSAAVTITYTPTAAGPPDGGSMAVGYTAGTTTGTLTLPMTGANVAGSGTLTPSPAAVTFSHVPLGQDASSTVSLTNTGNLPVTVTGFSEPGVPFTTPVPVPSGLTVNPGQDIRLPVTYTPQGLGSVTASYQLTYSDGRGAAVTEAVSVTGSAARPSSGAVVPGPGGGWTLNGSAQMKGTTLQLTGAARYQAGSAVYYQPLPSSDLHATFTEQSGGGSGADGLAFAMVSPQDPATVLGGSGRLLGFGGLHGVAVVVGTRKDVGFPSANFVGIATGASDGHLVFAATSSRVPNMRAGTHVVGVAVSGTTITVTVDGKQYLSASVPGLPKTVLAAFTAGTGAADDVHALTGVGVNANGFGTVPAPGGGWSYNGAAHMSGSDTMLDRATRYMAGTVIYPHPVATASLTAQFNAQIGGGTGANGLTFALLGPQTSARSVGVAGHEFGLGGLTGVAVVLSTYPVYGIPSSNCISIIGSSRDGLTVIATLAPLEQLRSGLHQFTVTVSKTSAGSLLTVSMDGDALVSRAVDLPSTALPAFTAGTGGLTDVHTVSDIAIAVG
jgi:hypothetical protein